VDLSPLADLLERAPGTRIVILNFDPLRGQARKLMSLRDVYFDISMVEGVGGVARLAKSISPQRVLFGSHYPLFYFDSALLKVRESGFTEEERTSIFEKNARGLLAP
jgi:predicted TIM-barrel fold metal-dependent hydrolase